MRWRPSSERPAYMTGSRPMPRIGTLPDLARALSTLADRLAHTEGSQDRQQSPLSEPSAFTTRSRRATCKSTACRRQPAGKPSLAASSAVLRSYLSRLTLASLSSCPRRCAAAHRGCAARMAVRSRMRRGHSGALLRAGLRAGRARSSAADMRYARPVTQARAPGTQHLCPRLAAPPRQEGQRCRKAPCPSRRKRSG
jgi:hypothetical protein